MTLGSNVTPNLEPSSAAGALNTIVDSPVRTTDSRLASEYQTSVNLRYRPFLDFRNLNPLKSPFPSCDFISNFAG